ncbi:hypothetical protein PRIPAC_90208 [Pristionchus pacificus]|uniref:Uncharacterized protein n=1 Tax=Pristionchus pacificus TaxID=54126 RepID=A0A2A6B8S5_PRIPA|nr:hypothetical protein PRIPAC_90208 [Pristionchus pacificus]|eukprot:PDM62275.1 hypothetical protein PRIPAC_51717 [Pristionchus pacificus]
MRPHSTMSALEIATTAAFYAALIIGVPTILLSYRCAYILIRKAGFRKNSFYRIFVASLISNSLVFLLLMHNLRFPGIGWFPNYYNSIKQVWWLPLQSFITRLFYNLSLLLSFMLSLNCVTRIMLKEEAYAKIWRHFLLFILPLLIFWSGFLNYDALINKAEYVQAPPDASGKGRYLFKNYNLTKNYDQYWVVVEIVLDIVCNTFVIKILLPTKLDKLHHAHSDYRRTHRPSLRFNPAISAHYHVSVLEHDSRRDSSSSDCIRTRLYSICCFSSLFNSSLRLNQILLFNRALMNRHSSILDDRSIDNSLNCSTKADSHRKYVCYSGRTWRIAEDVAYRRRRGVSPKTWRIAEDVAYRRRRGVSPKTWRIAEDVVYRRRRGVSPKTWCIAEDVVYRRRRGVSSKTWCIAEDVAYRRRRGVSPKTWRIAEDVMYRRRRGVSPKTWRIAEDVAYRRRRGVSPKTWCIAEDVAYRRKRGVSPKTWRIAEDVVYRRRRGVSPKT